MILESKLFGKIICSYFIGIFVFATSIYQSTALQFIYQVYHYHKLAYKSHIKSLVGLFVATEFALLFNTYMCGIKFAAYLCYYTDDEEL